MSDAYGRKQMYLYSLFISVLASIVCAFSTNIAMLIVFRAIQASGATSSQTLGAGVISDMFDVTERGRAYGLFFVG
jgi:MFS family permease